MRLHVRVKNNSRTAHNSSTWSKIQLYRVRELTEEDCSVLCSARPITSFPNEFVLTSDKSFSSFG